MSIIPFRLIGRQLETPTVVSLRLVPETGEPFKFTPGAFGLVGLDGSDIPARAFSFSSSPDDIELELTIERIGQSTTALHNAPIGSRILVDGPHGKFLLPETIDRDIIMIAGGTGIAPIRSMLRRLVKKTTGHQVAIFHSVRHAEDIMFRDEFNLLVKQAPTFFYQVTVTQPESAGEWTGPAGRLTSDRLLAQAPDLVKRLVFLCGSPKFVLAFIRSLTDLGIPRDSILTEQWHQPEGQ